MTKTVYYSGKNGVIVTSRYLRTRHKDQALAPITLIHIGREPFFFALAIGLSFGLFTFSFGDLLYLREKVLIASLAIAILVVGYSVASLHLGTHRYQKTMLWSNYWTIRRIRNAIVDARHAGPKTTVEIDLLDPPQE